MEKMQTANRPTHAPLHRRFPAAVLDAAALGLLYYLLFEIFQRLDRFCPTRIGEIIAAGALVAVALPGAYLFLFHLFLGRTPGKLLLGISLRNRAGGSLGPRQVFIRTVMQYFSLGFAGAGYLTVFFNPERRAFHDLVADTFVCHLPKGENAMTAPNTGPERPPRRVPRKSLRTAAWTLGGILVALVVLKSVFYKVPENQSVIHLRGGKFIAELKPGLHTMVPILDDVVRVNLAEQQGYIQHIDAMTADNVIMKVSLQYSFVVVDAVKYGLNLRQPFQMIHEFVQGRLRDIINTRTMEEVAHNRKEISDEVSRALSASQDHFGVAFRLVQIQATYPPEEVAQAIRERMVSEQRKQAATSDAEKEKILADAKFYSANRESEAKALEVERLAAAQQKSIGAMLGELQKSPELGQKYLDLLIAQELKANSKWVISSGAAPALTLQGQE